MSDLTQVYNSEYVQLLHICKTTGIELNCEFKDGLSQIFSEYVLLLALPWIQEDDPSHLTYCRDKN